MDDTPRSHNPGDAPPTTQPVPHERSGTPRWVKVFALVGVVLVVLVIVMLFTGHGPGRHTGDTGHAAGPTAALGALYDRPGSGS